MHVYSWCVLDYPCNCKWSFFANDALHKSLLINFLDNISKHFLSMRSQLKLSMAPISGNRAFNEDTANATHTIPSGGSLRTVDFVGWSGGMETSWDQQYVDFTVGPIRYKWLILSASTSCPFRQFNCRESSVPNCISTEINTNILFFSDMCFMMARC